MTLEDGTVVKSSDVLSEPKPGFIVTILGDTKFCPASIQLAEHAHIVVHEATFDASTTDLAASYGHATNIEAATVAKNAQAKNLIMTHISARFLKHDVEKLVAEAKEVFENSFVAHDFSLFELKNGHLISE